MHLKRRLSKPTDPESVKLFDQLSASREQKIANFRRGFGVSTPASLSYGAAMNAPQGRIGEIMLKLSHLYVRNGGNNRVKLQAVATLKFLQFDFSAHWLAIDDVVSRNLRI